MIRQYILRGGSRMTETETFDNRTVLGGIGIGIALFALLSVASPMGAGAYLIYQGSVAGGAGALGGGLAAIGGALTTYAGASTIGTAMAVGIGLTAVGGLIGVA